MIRRPPRSTLSPSSAASDVYKRQVSDKAGSIEVGKDANIVISEGDLLDMKSSNVTDAYIQGRKIDLNDKQKQLNDRYNQKYNLKKPF